MPCCSCPDDGVRRRTRTLVDHQSANIFSREPDTIEKLVGRQCLTPDMDERHRRTHQMCEATSDGKRSHCVRRAVEGDQQCRGRPSSVCLPPGSPCRAFAAHDVAPAGTCAACRTINDCDRQLAGTLHFDARSERDRRRASASARVPATGRNSASPSIRVADEDRGRFRPLGVGRLPHRRPPLARARPAPRCGRRPRHCPCCWPGRSLPACRK